MRMPHNMSALKVGT